MSGPLLHTIFKMRENIHKVSVTLERVVSYSWLSNNWWQNLQLNLSMHVIDAHTYMSGHQLNECSPRFGNLWTARGKSRTWRKHTHSRTCTLHLERLLQPGRLNPCWNEVTLLTTAPRPSTSTGHFWLKVQKVFFKKSSYQSSCKLNSSTFSAGQVIPNVQSNHLLCFLLKLPTLHTGGFLFNTSVCRCLEKLFVLTWRNKWISFN